MAAVPLPAGASQMRSALRETAMNIGSICTRDVVMVGATDTLQQAAALMREHHVGALVVVGQSDRGSKAVGIVTDRDLVIEAMARGLPGDNVRVGSLIDRPLVTVSATASLDDAIGVLEKAGVRRLLVTTPEGRLAGILSLDDLLDALAARTVALARALRGGVAREVSERGPLAVPDLGGVEVALP
jgi:CBS domain-containing protein